MAFLSIPNVKIAGISAAVPKNVVSNFCPAEDDAVSSEYSPADFVALTGVEERHVSKKLTTSDLCFKSAEKLIADLNWVKSEIFALIFVTQTPDYIQPATACIMQNRLGLSKECYALDISLGCSGWVYGLSVAASLCSTGAMKKVLLLAGEAKEWFTGLKDPLLGHAGTATALEFQPDAPVLNFHFGTDGSGYDAIITPDGGCRNPITEKSFIPEEIDGKMLCRNQTQMKGMDVFAFGISTVPKAIKSMGTIFGFDYLNLDYFVFHQANMKMVNFISKKMKIPSERVPFSMRKYGNTSSASIPLTIVTELKPVLEKKSAKILCCGFGIGFSWGSVVIDSNGVLVSNLVEVADNDCNEEWV